MNLIYFIIVLSVTIMIHELGHFLFAKKFGVHVYEFCLGMGPKIFSKKKNETEYSIRLFPIGGFVSMAGEDVEDNENIPKDKHLCNKSWLQRFITLIAGITFNILLAIVLLVVIALIAGAPSNELKIGQIEEQYPISETDIKENDVIKEINGKKVSSYEDLTLELAVNNGKEITITVEHENNKTEDIKVKPILTEKDGQSGYLYGFSINREKETGIVNSIKYAFVQTKNLTVQMVKILFYLITGKLSVNSLSGPIGIYSIVGTAAAAGFLNVLYLIAYLCINVAIINIIPIPAFDGGRILFLIIEKIKGSKVNPKIENAIHSVGFMVLMALMIYVTINDIFRIFN